MGILDRLSHAWNAFVGKGDDDTYYQTMVSQRPNINVGIGNGRNPDRAAFTRGNERSIVTTVYNKMALDVAAIDIRHVRTDENGKYIATMDSKLNYCLNTEANIDQEAKVFLHDVVVSLFDEGHVAIVPIDTVTKLSESSTIDIITMRVGKITQWHPKHVEVEVYDDNSGLRRTLLMDKKKVAIIENPHYAVMNENNSILQRLIRKLNLLDVVDEQSSSGKLDLIIQLPNVVRSGKRKEQAQQRIRDLEDQLQNGKYGIAYTDGTEKIHQLNRPIENNLMKQIEFLTSMLYSQLGISKEILEGTAGEEAMLNYITRAVVPVISAITNEINRKFLTNTARTQKQKVMFFNDPFKLVPISKLAEISDKLTRNEILTPNEVRQIIGLIPSADPKADELRNRNINQGNQETMGEEGYEDEEYYEDEEEVYEDDYEE